MKSNGDLVAMLAEKAGGISEIYSFLCEEDRVHSEHLAPRRWWIETFEVVEVDGILIGFTGAQTTGDESAEEKGWTFDPKSIFEAEKQEIKSFQYVRKG